MIKTCKTVALLASALVLSLSAFFQAPVFAASFKEIKLDPADRILILCPHPDDEVLGCGGVIQAALKKHLPIKVVFLTYGDNNEWSFLVYRMHPVLMPRAAQAMGRVRHDEAVASAKVLGLSPDQLIFLGYPDFRSIQIWYAHWGERLPIKSMLTRVKAVPYKDAFHPGAPYKGEEIVGDLKTILTDFKPTKIFVSHPGDHNGDHRALYLFTRVALWDLGAQMQPDVFPYLVHFFNWPNPKGYHPYTPFVPPDYFKDRISWFIFPLSSDEVANNYRALKQHKSQFRASPKYLLSFIRAWHIYGDLPPAGLVDKGSSALLSGVHPEKGEFPDELIDEERDSFVAIDQDFVRREDDQLVFSIKLSKPLGKKVGASLYVFGYRADKPFSEMPKLHVVFGSGGDKVFDQDCRVANDAVTLKRNPTEVSIRIPLKQMGNPERVLTTIQTHRGNVPLDWVPWREVDLSELKG